LFNLAFGCHVVYQGYNDDLSEDEVETVGGFVQNLQDWIDICGDLQPIDKIRATKSILNRTNLPQARDAASGQYVCQFGPPR